jgi:hypothetical protein
MYPTEDGRMIPRSIIRSRLSFPHFKLPSRMVLAKILDKTWSVVL